MKNCAFLLAVVGTLFVGVPAHAQSSSNSSSYAGKGAMASKSAATQNDFAWGIALAGIAVIGTIVGVTVAAATSNPNS